jgi:stage II sporulation protein D
MRLNPIKIVITLLIITFFFSFQEKSEVYHSVYDFNDGKRKNISEDLINVRLFSQLKIQSFTFSADAGLYAIWANSKEIVNTSQYPIIKISYVNDSVEVKTFENNLGRFKKIRITSSDYNKAFRIKLIYPERKPRFYEDNLVVEAETGNLKCINEVLLDNYISGVVQAESGRRAYQEFYKVQAILARTFALNNIMKHNIEGYNLCDHTHCQVYFGRTTELEIMKAVTETKGRVVVDENLNLIDATFHSNSGGQTANSEDVWGKKLPYLRSVQDSFSIKMPNARWERKMAKDDWLSYLKLKHNIPVDDSSIKHLALNFSQETRKSHLEINNYKVPLRNIRTDLQLKSTFFSIVPVGDSLVFKGKGFGHGVGMCQEGAMNMAKLGYNHEQVIRFYYQNIKLIDLNKLNFFKDE